MADRDLLTMNEFGEAVGVTRSTVKRWIREGIIPVVRIGGVVRIPSKAVPRPEYTKVPKA